MFKPIKDESDSTAQLSEVDIDHVPFKQGKYQGMTPYQVLHSVSDAKYITNIYYKDRCSKELYEVAMQLLEDQDDDLADLDFN